MQIFQRKNKKYAKFLIFRENNCEFNNQHFLFGGKIRKKIKPIPYFDQQILF